MATSPETSLFICDRCKREVTTAGHFCPFCGAVAPQENETRDPYIGQTVAQKYFIHQLLGGGGMGQVYKATHLTLERPIALKILKRSLLADESIVQRFHREARLASRLNHPNSISLIDFGQTEDGTLFIAMEYLGGRNLLKLISDEFPLDPRRVVKILSQVLAALTEAHALGILHRDLKPENVMVESRHDETDFVKVLDFGIAKIRDSDDPGAARLTQAGMVCGTPGYMSPEQTRGDELDARSDLYSVGVILYELLTGKLPFEAKTPQTLATKVLFEVPIRASERRPDLALPPDLEALAMRALSTDPEGRPATAEEFRRELLACAPREPVTPAFAHTTVLLDRTKKLTPRPSPPSPEAAIRAVYPAGPGLTQEISRASERLEASPTPRPLTPSAERRFTPKPDRVSARPDEVEAEDETEIADQSAASKSQSESQRRAARSHLPLVVGSGVGVALLVVLVVIGLRPKPQPRPEPKPPVSQSDPRGSKPFADLQPPPDPKPEVSSLVGSQDQRAEPERPAPEESRPPPPPSKPRNAIRAITSSLKSLRVPEASSDEGILSIEVTPWADVSIDGKPIGDTPKEVRIAAGKHKIRLSHPDFPPIDEIVAVTAGKRNWFRTNLQR
ncbi:MAG: serine/threonine-protein kinase [Myxococcales bacterium]